MTAIEETKQPGLDTQATDLATQAMAIVVNNDDDDAIAANFLKDCKALEREIESVMKPIVAAAHKAHKVAKEQENRLLDPIKKAQDDVGLIMGAYRKKCEAERKEQEAALRAQVLLEQEETRLQSATHLSEAGYIEAADKMLDMPLPPIDESEIRLDSPAPKARGTVSRTTWKSKVVDASLVPREYLIPDVKHIDADVRRTKGEIEIPGVRMWSETKVGTRGAG